MAVLKPTLVVVTSRRRGFPCGSAPGTAISRRRLHEIPVAWSCSRLRVSANGLEAGLRAEFASAVSGVVVGICAVAHTRKQMMPKLVKLVFQVGAPVAKKRTIAD